MVWRWSLYGMVKIYIQQIQEEPQQQVVLPELMRQLLQNLSNGYIFDEQLQARLDTTLPNQPEPTAYDFYEVPYEDAGLLGDYGANLIYG